MGQFESCQVQDFRNLSAERALSDFRRPGISFVLSAIYLMPFQGWGVFLSRLAQGWSVAPIVNLQSGNPFSPIIRITTDTRGNTGSFQQAVPRAGRPVDPAESLTQSVDQSGGVRRAGHRVRRRWPEHSHRSRILRMSTHCRSSRTRRSRERVSLRIPGARRSICSTIRTSGSRRTFWPGRDPRSDYGYEDL